MTPQRSSLVIFFLAVLFVGGSIAWAQDDLNKVALYRQGKSLLDQQKYEDSYRTLAQLVRLAPNYEDTNSLLWQARTRLVQRHYSEGLRFYREEKPEEAIAQWRTVLEYDPQHAEAKRNIERAERLLKGLQYRQQPRKP